MAQPTYCYPYRRGTGWRSQGFRSNPNQGANGPGGHTGYDQAMDVGTRLYSPCDGIVRNSSWVTDNYLENDWWLTRMGGDCLVIDATSPFIKSEHLPTFILCHLQDSIAAVGQVVRKGQLVATSGNSGTATTGPHCHIEALPPNWDVNNGVYGRVDPEQYFTEWPEDQPQGLAAQGTITPEEDTLSAADVAAINAHTTEQADRVIGYIGQLLTSEYKMGRQTIPGGNRVGIETQRRVSATLALVTEMAKNPGLTADEAQAIIETAMKSTVKVDVNIEGATP